MSALIADRPIPRRKGLYGQLPVKGGVIIFLGSIVGVDAAGFLRGGSDAAMVKALGISEEYVDTTGLGDGAKTCKYTRGSPMNCDTPSSGGDQITVANLGQPAWVIDDHTLGATSSNATRVYGGKIIGVQADGTVDVENMDDDTPRSAGQIAIAAIWVFLSSSLQLLNVAKTFVTSLVSTATADRTITLPDATCTLAQAGANTGAAAPASAALVSGTGTTAAGQVMTSTDSKTATLNQYAGCFLVTATANAPLYITGNTAVIGAPLVLTVLGTPVTDAGIYKIVGVANHTHTQT